MHLRHKLTQTMNLQLTHTWKTHSTNSITAPMPQGKCVENRFNQNLECKAAQQVLRNKCPENLLSEAPFSTLLPYRPGKTTAATPVFATVYII